MTTLRVRDGLVRLGGDAFLSAVASSCRDAVITKSIEGLVIFWNDAAERMYGYSSSEMVGRDIGVIFPPERKGELTDILLQVQLGKSVTRKHTQRIRKDGSIVQVAITVTPVLDDDKNVIGASTIVHDLTSHIEMARKLNDAERRAAEALSTLQTLQESAPVGFGYVDREFRYVHMNDMLAATIGKPSKEILGRTVAEVVPDIWPQVASTYMLVLEENEAVLNIEVSGPTAQDPGRTHHWLSSYYPVHLDNEVIGIGIVLVDVTDRRRAEEFRSTAMRQMAEGLFATDERGLTTYMNQAVTSILGWTESDLMGKKLHDFIHTRREDGTPITSEADCEHQVVRTEGRSIRGDDLFTCKDGKLLPISYSAAPISTGTAGEGTVIVFRDTSEEISESRRIRRELEELTWVGRIREALDEDRFVLYSQPILSLNGQPPSEELLIRMIGRNGDVVPPAMFLNAAEKFGMIIEIDRWVVRQAIKRAAEGHHVGANISAESIVSSGLLSLIRGEIHNTGADPRNLVFEITETALMRDTVKGEAFAREVVDLGCSVALDDFGTGFGTFTHVKKLPVEYLKIDIEFVRDLVSSSANQHVVKAIVNLAHGFGCKTVAEGVEDAETLELLRELDVDFAQGFHLGRPLPL